MFMLEIFLNYFEVREDMILVLLDSGGTILHPDGFLNNPDIKLARPVS